MAASLLCLGAIFATLKSMSFYAKSLLQTYDELDSGERGLADSSAAERLERYGPNRVTVKGEPLWRKIVEPFANVFMAVLAVAVGISIWHHDYIEAGIIGAIMIISATIYYVQRFSTERVLRALQSHTREEVEVLRDGQIVLLDTEELVPGDVIYLSEGQKIPADGRLIQVDSLRVDESQLTGESLPIGKQLDALSAGKEVYEQTNMVFAGSFVVGGKAQAIITATANQSQFGKLAVLSGDVMAASPVQEKIDKLITRIVFGVTVIAVVAFMLAMRQGMDSVEALRFVIALAVSAVPEGLPIAISVVLVLGMRRMAAKKALVRTMRAIETLGTLTTIATDKTGTLTKNKLTIQDSWQPQSATMKLEQVLRGALTHGDSRIRDPLDTSIADYLSLHNVARGAAPLKSFPFDQDLSMSGGLFHHANQYQLLLKGAPEAILERAKLPAAQSNTAIKTLHDLTSKGYRVIALASCELKKPLKSLNDIPTSAAWTFQGFIAVADILRPEAKRAISRALSAGVTVRMITGDHFETAYHIGRELGMVNSRDQVFDSRQMHTMSDEELGKVVDDIRVFSRVIPEHKHRLLTILKQHNITAMTGDGVNDVPALTNAHVGVAMGSGASIAKEAGDIVLIDDNFKSIIDAIAEGRTIFGNIKRMVAYLLSTNAGEVMLNLTVLALGIPIPLLPAQILWINLVTDTSLVIPLGLEPGSKDVMKQKPAVPNGPLFSRYMIARIALVATSIAGLTLAMYLFFSDRYGTDYGRTIAFCTIVAMQWGNALVMRSTHDSLRTILSRPNKPFWIGLCLSIGLQLLAIFTPLAGFLHVSPVALEHIAICSVIGIAMPIVINELHKWWRRSRATR